MLAIVTRFFHHVLIFFIAIVIVVLIELIRVIFIIYIIFFIRVEVLILALALSMLSIFT